MVKAYIWFIGQISRFFALLATLLIISAMLVVCQMILLRYLFALPTIWQTDFVVFSATVAMFLGAPYVLLKNGHVGVDVVEMMVTTRTRLVLQMVGSVLGLVFCLAMLVASWIQFHDAWAGDWRHSSMWAPPLWIPLFALPLSFAMLCLQYTAKILSMATGTGMHAAGVEPAVDPAGDPAIAPAGGSMPSPKSPLATEPHSASWKDASR
ncbi:TRAP transporter small permease subunit [Rhizobium sp. SSA_523]|uniref:TRAP transporter small permease subunit n=1 Tax=Rhizobium sp. SSA_523 TaxID=2952477 RepID=UPI002091B7AD|nr:TRAP transporter small permease [Rhizobium sp. SSA_523]MCO5731412.1 TRAP transporter small permease [Rhizobium sp. SSA_523]WKC22063.1 TRAP transporter small permease [Rhizobium sp. SSA_523]